MNSETRQLGRCPASPVKRWVVCLVALLFATTTQSREWLPESPVSFYETEAETTGESRFSGLLAQYPGLSLSETLEIASASESRDRPYGFGRELDDTSPVDYPGLKRDTAYFFGYQFFIVGLLYVMPEDISAWSDEQKEEYTLSKWWDNVSHPRWDPDEWYINYILHPYWGMTYYTRGRERGLSETGAFWFSFTLSAIYEFGLEALFEPVSIQDVIFTPTVGALLGWYFEDTRREIKRQSSFGFWDKTVLIATDPLGTLNTMVDDLFGVGVESELELRAFYRSPNLNRTETATWNDPHAGRSDPLVTDYLGLQLTLRWH
ncbi:MAG: DUF3943 domain-containing protein [Candidatus Thiodiazotropha sp. (ex Dulcina madagascariensis)]|nr:DUF3943 domain-containing protein [Candidatus Thiodiazotropha sp. (ex Dulcina madagascariensis)]